jgi:hypothetical protein
MKSQPVDDTQQSSSLSDTESAVGFILEIRQLKENHRKEIQEIRQIHRERLATVEAVFKQKEEQLKVIYTRLLSEAKDKIKQADERLSKIDQREGVGFRPTNVRELWGYYAELGYEVGICKYCKLFIVHFSVANVWRHIAREDFSLDYSSCKPANTVDYDDGRFEYLYIGGEKATPYKNDESIEFFANKASLLYEKASSKENE